MTQLRAGYVALLLGANAACVREVSTTPSAYSLGGHVEGLAGTLVLANDGVLLPLTEPGAFVFPDGVRTGTVFSVRVRTQPGGQECVVHNGVDMMANQNVTGIIVTCARNLYTLGGRVIGLDGASGGVILSNGNDRLVMNGAGAFTFPGAVAYNAASAVQVVRSPNDWTCTVQQPGGPVVQDINSVEVTCVRSYSVGGPVRGATDSLILINSGVLLAVSPTQSSFAFTGLLNGGAYVIAVVRPPSGQNCDIDNPSGRVVGDNVANVAVNCSDTTYSVSGTISGNANDTVVSNSGSRAITLNRGASVFLVPGLRNGQSYNLGVTAVTGQACTLRGPSSGVIDSANVQGVVITCSDQNQYNVGGKVTGAEADVTLIDTGTSPATSLVVSPSNPNFAFRVYGGSRYSVSVTSSPPGQLCRVSNASGQVSQSNINNLTVSCYSYNLSGTIAGDSNGLILKAWQNGTLRRLPMAGNSNSFRVANFLPNDQYGFGVYASSPGNRCTATGNLSGTVQNSNISGIAINCQPRTYRMFVSAYGLQSGDILALRLHEHPEIRAVAVSYPDSSGNLFFDTVITGVPNKGPATLEFDPATNLHGKSCSFFPNSSFYVRNANIGTIHLECGTNPPPSGTQTFENLAPLYDFETTTQGWDQVYSVTNSSIRVVRGPLALGPVYQGQGALEFAFTHAGEGDGCSNIRNAAGVGVAGSPAALGGAYAVVRYWYPAEMSAFSSWGFMDDITSYAYNNTSSVNEPDTWVVSFIPIPSGAMNIGVRICTTADYTGSFFVDSVDYPLQ